MTAILSLLETLKTIAFGFSLIGNTSPSVETPNWSSAIENLNYGHSVYMEYKRNYFEYGWLKYDGITYNTQDVRIVKDILEWNIDSTKIGEFVLGANSFIDQAKEIDYQEMYCTFDVNIKKAKISAGFSKIWENLGNPRPCMKVGIDYNWIVKCYANLTTNFSDRRIVDIGAMRSWRLTDGILFEIGLVGRQQEQVSISYGTKFKVDVSELLKQ